MERLTAWSDYGAYFPKCYEEPCDGNVTENDCDNCGFMDDVCRKLAQYEDIGTLEEVRDAVEKQKAKKPIKSDDKICDLIVHYRCPCCEKYFGGRGIHDVVLFSKERYCNDCGQRIDWSEEE